MLSSTRVPTADRPPLPMMRSPSVVAGDGPILGFGRTLADHHHVGDPPYADDFVVLCTSQSQAEEAQRRATAIESACRILRPDYQCRTRERSHHSEPLSAWKALLPIFLHSVDCLVSSQFPDFGLRKN